MRRHRRTSTLVSQAGGSMVEVMVTVGIVAGVMGSGVLAVDRDYLDLATAKQNLVTDLRRARMQATLKGAHVRFETQGSSYVISRLEDDDGDGEWEVDTEYAPRTVELPTGLNVIAPASAEFDGRGLLVSTGNGYSTVMSVYLTDAEGQRKVVEIWPSGQVEDAAGSGGLTSS